MSVHPVQSCTSCHSYGHSFIGIIAFVVVSQFHGLVTACQLFSFSSLCWVLVSPHVDLALYLCFSRISPIKTRLLFKLQFCSPLTLSVTVTIIAWNFTFRVQFIQIGLLMLHNVLWVELFRHKNLYLLCTYALGILLWMLQWIPNSCGPHMIVNPAISGHPLRKVRQQISGITFGFNRQMLITLNDYIGSGLLENQLELSFFLSFLVL